MGSINAQQVGIKVLESIKKGEKVEVGKIMLKTGYSHKTSLNPKLVTSTKSYQKALELERIPLIEGLQKEINRIKIAMAKRNLDNEEYRTLVGSLDVLTRNYQLLSGGATERQVFVLPSEVMEKNNIQEINGSTEP